MFNWDEEKERLLEAIFGKRVFSDRIGRYVRVRDKEGKDLPKTEDSDEK